MAKVYGSEIAKIEIDPMQFKECERLLNGIKNGTRDMLKMSINKVVSGTKTDVKKAVAEEINLTQARIAKDIFDTTATKENLSASVYSKGKRIEVVEFAAKQTKAGVTYKIQKSGSRSTMQGGFIAKGKSTGQMHVLKRVVKVGTGTPIGSPAAGFLWTFPAAWPRELRYPAWKKYGPSIPAVWGKPLVLADTLAKAQARLVTEMDRATTKLLADADKGIV